MSYSQFAQHEKCRNKQRKPRPHFPLLDILHKKFAKSHKIKDKKIKTTRRHVNDLILNKIRRKRKSITKVEMFFYES